MATEASAESRFLHQLRALFALLLATGARVGDILALRIDGVRFFGGVMILSIDPRPSDGKLKNTGSRRQVRVEQFAILAVVKEWVSRRRAEGATSACLLFGCPDGTHRVWQRVPSLVHLRRLVQAATGETFIGGHVLRHTRVTDFAGSTEATPEAERQFHAFAASLGHGADVTTRRDYDHSSDVLLKRALGELNRDIPVSWAAAAQWLGSTEVAVRKRASRSGMERKTFIARALNDASRALNPDEVSTRYSYVERIPPKRPHRVDGLRLAEVLAVCRDLAEGTPMASIAWRNLVDAGVVRRIALKILGEAGVLTTIDESEARFQFRVGEAMDRLREVADFDRLDQPKVALLVRYATRDAARPMLLRACISWERIRRGRYLSLERAEHARELLQFLRGAGVTVEQVAAAVSSEDDVNASSSAPLEQTVLARITDVFGRRPELQRVNARSGRPRAYLLFKERDRPGTSSAAVSVAGLQALMLAASFWRQLLEGAP